MKVFINPGHSENGIPDPGASYNGYKEAIIARQIGDKLAEILKSYNIEVELYQQRNEKGESLTANQQLNRVPKKANASKADIFVSIHLNAASNPTARGTETLCSNGSKNGEKLANLINSKLSSHFINRGVKIDTRGLLVLKATNMPAVLTEVGFISNLTEINYIKANIQEIAKQIAYGILEYFNIKIAIEQKCKNKIILEENEDGLYNCYVNDIIKLKANKLRTCLGWIDKNVK